MEIKSDPECMYLVMNSIVDETLLGENGDWLYRVLN